MPRPMTPNETILVDGLTALLNLDGHTEGCAECTAFGNALKAGYDLQLALQLRCSPSLEWVWDAAHAQELAKELRGEL